MMQMAVAMQDAAQRAEVLQEVKRLAVSYAGLVVQFPDSFASSSSSISAVTVLTEKLLEDRISPEFLGALVKWSNEENNLDAVRPCFCDCLGVPGLNPRSLFFLLSLAL